MKKKKLSPNIILLPWCNDAAERWFSNFNNQPWSMLLHSGYAESARSRFDILVADPIGTVVTRGNVTYVSFQEKFSSSEDPFLLLSKIVKNLNFYAERCIDLPFQGGALGLFGYDLARRIEKIPNYALRDIDLPDMAIGLYDWALIIDHKKQKVSLLSHSDIQERLNWLKMQRRVKHENFRLISPWNSNMNVKEYTEKFSKTQDYLWSGDCYQINLSQRFQAYCEGNVWQAFVLLNKQNRAPFSAFLCLEEGFVLSFSPERFINLSDGIIQTSPIKGTLPRLSSHEADKKQALNLAKSLKDRAENLMIVDLMRNDIGRVAKPGTVQVPELFVVESFPAVHHLVSTVKARLSSSYDAFDLLRATFPGGSVTGAPKIRAMEIIEELEPHRRNAWCGSIGYLSVCGNLDTNITIRTLIVSNNQIYCSAGSGIVSDSQPRSEYQETFDKVNAILQQLETFSKS